MTQAPFRSRARLFLRQEILPMLVLAFLLFSARSSLADWYYVPSGSMRPTILEGDRVLVNKLAYDLKAPFTHWHVAQWDDPKRGDVVVFPSPQDDTRLVKRVVGLPGDLIEMHNNRLFINGQSLAYGPIDVSVCSQLDATALQESQLATEHLPGRAHAVMALPHLPAMRSFGPVQVPAGHYFMMGDNRDNSHDSRFFGPVARSRILGQAVGIVISLDPDCYKLPRLNRIFRPMDAGSST